MVLFVPGVVRAPLLSRRRDCIIDRLDMDMLDPSGQYRQKKNLNERVFVNWALKIQCHVFKKYTPTNCFFGDFDHWDRIKLVFFIEFSFKCKS